MDIPRVLYYLAICSWLGLEAWIGLREKGQVLTGKDKNSRILFAVASFLALYLGTKLAATTHFPILNTQTADFVVGALIIFVGIGIRMWAVLTLGRFFRTTVMVQDQQHVISNGPYKFVRHPSYVGILLAILGVGVGSGNLLSLLAMWGLILAALLYRINIEEKVLSKELGAAYQKYMQQTKKLIPFIY